MTAEEAAQGNPQRDLRVRAAWMYYVEGFTQAEVAARLRLNRVAVTRLISESKRLGEVEIRVRSDILPILRLERELEAKFGLERAIVAPLADPEADPTRVVAAAAGRFVSETILSRMTVGLGWGRTLYETLGHIQGRPLRNLRVISLLGGIIEAKRYNPSEFAWRFAELFDAEGFLVSAPALVDSPKTRHSLLEQCGLDQVFQLAESSDIALVSCGGINTLTTSYRVGHLSEQDRRSLQEAGAVGDILYNFVDAKGAVLDHPVNHRCVSMGLDRLERIRRRVLVSGGTEKTRILLAAMRRLEPTEFITDEQTAGRLLAGTAET